LVEGWISYRIFIWKLEGSFLQAVLGNSVIYISTYFSIIPPCYFTVIYGSKP
jgi:hypothetical protein